MGAMELFRQAIAPMGRSYKSRWSFSHDHLLHRQEPEVPAQSRAQQQPRVVPRAQGRLRRARARTIPLAVSEHFRAEPKAVGGSLFRIQRDTRFANDKAPYKAWQGARLFHERRQQVAAPSFYLHLQPGHCFVGAGLWHPETATQRLVRQFIVDNPGSWKQAAHAPAFRRRFELESDEMLVRPPRGFAPDFEFIDDLRHKNFVASRPLDDSVMLGTRLRQTLVKDMQALAPFVDYLCAALDLEF